MRRNVGGVLNPFEQARFARQLLLPELGEGGQEKLRSSSVLVVGAGGLGSPVLTYLAAAGVGHIAISDGDTLNTSNLHRQVIHGLQDMGRNKALSARSALTDLAGDMTTVEAFTDRLSYRDMKRMFGDYDLVVDATDNFETRYAISDAGAVTGTTVVWGAVLGFDAQVSVFMDGLTLRDVHFAPPAGEQIPKGGLPVIGPLVGQAGTVMAMEAIKVLGGFGNPLVGRLLIIDSKNARFYELPVKKRATT